MLQSLVHIRLNARLNLVLLRAVASSHLQRLLEVSADGLEKVVSGRRKV